LFVLVLVAVVPARADAAVPWRLPVHGPVVRGFVAPVTRYGPGHFGVHFVVPPGTTVRAAGTGVVSFVGWVDGVLYVVVRHPGDLRTTYGFLAATEVHNGDQVTVGQVLGTTRGPILHFGLRRGDEYLDPMQLFRPPRVELAPLDDPVAPMSDAGRG
jgi:murein DD-endopeptidase MepM/ murein hydrolase activator NlpD